MLHNKKDVPLVGTIILMIVLLNVLIIRFAFVKDESWYRMLFITMPVLGIAITYFRKLRLTMFKKEEPVEHPEFYFGTPVVDPAKN